VASVASVESVVEIWLIWARRDALPHLVFALLLLFSQQRYPWNPAAQRATVRPTVFSLLLTLLETPPLESRLEQAGRPAMTSALNPSLVAVLIARANTMQPAANPGLSAENPPCTASSCSALTARWRRAGFWSAGSSETSDL
jgi:hypothetical protein